MLLAQRVGFPQCLHLADMNVHAPESLHEELIGLRQENGNLRQENAAQCLRLAELEHQLAELRRLMFGVKSERYVPEADTGQATLFDEAEPAAPLPQAETITVERRLPATKRRPVRQPLPAHLPREVIVIEPEEDTANLRQIGTDVTETLDYVAAKLKVIRRERPRYVDPGDEDRGVIVAALPPQLIDKGLAEPGLLAHVMVEKYCDHLPLYRQQQRFKREGITLSSLTLGDWIAKTAWNLVPLQEALKQEVLQSGYLQADETTIQVQDRKKKGKAHRGYYWVYLAPEPQLVVIDYRKGRARDGPEAFLRGYAGALQTDGYAVYDVFDCHKSITIFGCMAHARRKFYEARDSEPQKAGYVLEQLKKIYAIEREAREQGACPALRRQMRQERAGPVFVTLKGYLEDHMGLPRSVCGKAVRYLMNRWEKLTRFLDDGRIEADKSRYPYCDLLGFMATG